MKANYCCQLPFLVGWLVLCNCSCHWLPCRGSLSATRLKRKTTKEKPPHASRLSYFKIPGNRSTAMAACQKLYPRATVKKIVKAHSRRNLSKNVDVLVMLDDASPERTTKPLCRYSSTTLSSYKRMPPVQVQPSLHRLQIAGLLEDMELIIPLRLMKEATINAKQAGERGISAKSVKKVTEVCSA